MFLNTFSKHLCCSLDVTIASRIIGFVGIMISVLLMTVLLNDKYFNKKENYDLSRKTALAFGLDWQHFYQNASTSAQDDPAGKMISIIVTFYSIAFLVINLLLFFSTIKENKESEESLYGKVRFIQDIENMDSPGPYTPNTMYALI
ncbi:hypothetical protein NQ314_006527 [Rhamnusium bicolor]|uniref:Ion transport domain-containing protein n=1 Tax=Rhamnusium bicolor TaxID=1586634 RepID=A0AAV8Z127_9CUCU|nr:hypothetical protein NQ314_006527 [Rhamnusium bicolor]